MNKHLSTPFYGKSVKANPSPIWIIKADDITFYSINSVAASEFQYSEKELIGQSLLTVCPNFSKNELHAFRFKDFKKEIMTKIRRKDGTEQIAKLKISSFIDEQEFYFYIIVNPLISSSKNNSDKILSDFFYEYSFSTNIVPIIIVNKDSLKILDVNDSAIRLYGYSRDEFQQLNITNLHHPTDFENAFKFFNSIKENRYNRFEVKHLSKNNRVIEAEIFIQLVKTYDGYIMMIIIHDVSEKKLVLRVLEENLNNYKLIANNATDLIVLHMLDGKIKYTSPASLKLLGYRPGFLTLNNIYDFVHPDDVIKIKSGFSNISESTSFKTRFRIKNFENKYLWFETNSKLISEQNSTSEKEIISIFKDVTEIVEMENKLIESQEKAGEIEKLKRTILANISHEMRTPLQSIIGYSQIMNDKINDDSLSEELNGIIENGQRLLRLINLFLNLTYLEANNFFPHFEQHNIDEIISNVTESFSDKAEEKGIELKTNISHDPILVKTDKILLRDILDNLIDNSIKFTNQGYILLSTVAKKDNFYNRVEITIEDTGIGIPFGKEDLALEAFRQISEGLSRSYEGIGLGLYLSKKLVEKINGKLELTSIEGRGTKVKLYLPISE